MTPVACESVSALPQKLWAVGHGRSGLRLPDILAEIGTHQVDGPADPGIAAVQTRGVAKMATNMKGKVRRLRLAGRPEVSRVPALDQLHAELQGRVGALKDE